MKVPWKTCGEQEGRGDAKLKREKPLGGEGGERWMDKFIRQALEELTHKASLMRESYHRARAERLLALVDEFCARKNRTTLLAEERAHNLVRENRIMISVQLHRMVEGHQSGSAAIKSVLGRLEQHALRENLPRRERRRRAA